MHLRILIVTALAAMLAIAEPAAAATHPYTSPDGVQITFGDATVKAPDDIEVDIACAASPSGTCYLDVSADAAPSHPRYGGIYRWPNPNLGELPFAGPAPRPPWGALPSCLARGIPVEIASCLPIHVGQHRTVYFNGWVGPYSQRSYPPPSAAKLRWRAGVLYGRLCADPATCVAGDQPPYACDPNGHCVPSSKVPLQRWGVLRMDTSHAYTPPFPLAKAVGVSVHRSGTRVVVKALVRCSADRSVRSCVVRAHGGPGDRGQVTARYTDYLSAPQIIPRGATSALVMHLRTTNKREGRLNQRAWSYVTKAMLDTTECNTARPHCTVSGMKTFETSRPSLLELDRTRLVRVRHD